MSANDDFQRGITMTAQDATGAIPAIVFPATNNVSWKLTDLQALLIPARWAGNAFSNSALVEVLITNQPGASGLGTIHYSTSTHFQDGTGAGFGAAFLREILVGTNGVSNEYIGFLWQPIQNFIDTVDVPGVLSNTIRNTEKIFLFTAWSAGEVQKVDFAGFTLDAPFGQLGQMLQVWDGPPSVGAGGILLGEYLLGITDGSPASFSDAPQLIATVGNQMTITVDGAVPATTIQNPIPDTVGFASTPSNTSLLATAAPI